MDKIIISKDRKTAKIITELKTFTVYSSTGNVVEMVNDMFLKAEKAALEEETPTQIINVDDEDVLYDFSLIGIAA